MAGAFGAVELLASAQEYQIMWIEILECVAAVMLLAACCVAVGHVIAERIRGRNQARPTQRRHVRNELTMAAANPFICLDMGCANRMCIAVPESITPVAVHN